MFCTFIVIKDNSSVYYDLLCMQTADNSILSADFKILAAVHTASNMHSTPTAQSVL